MSWMPTSFSGLKSTQNLMLSLANGLIPMTVRSPARAVEIIIDQWNPSQRRYRFETFCYGPKSCSLYKAGPTRKVPGRKGMSWEEEDWVDEEATAHRGEDE